MTEIKIHSVKFNFIMNIMLKLSQIIFPLVTLPYITRVIGAENNGKIAFVLSFVNYFCTLSQLGIPTYGVRVCAQCRDDKDKLSKTVQEIIFINMISCIFSYILLGVCYIVSNKLREEPVLLLISSASVLLNALGMEWFYQSIEKYKYITIRSVGLKFISIIFMFIMVRNPDDYVIYGFLSVFSSVGSNILNIINTRKYLYYKKYNDYDIKRHLKPIGIFFALSAAVSVYANMDTVMLGYMSSDTEVGYYNLASKIKLTIAQIASALGPVVLPRISYYIEKNKIDEFHTIIYKSLHFVLLFALAVTIFFTIEAEDVIQILGGNGYLGAIGCMRVIVWAVPPLAIGNVACMQILAPLGKEIKTMYSTICGAVINLVANSLLIPRYGACGAALGTVITEFIVAAIQLYFSIDILKYVIKKINYCVIFLALFTATCALVIVRSISPIRIVLIRIAFESVIFFLLYIIILLLLKDSLVKELVKFIKKVIHRNWEKHNFERGK